MNHTFLNRIFRLSLLIIILTGCNSKQDIQFKIEDNFQKVLSIPLAELETNAELVYTDFGFYAVEQDLCRISKYNNSGEYEFSFGKKGRGPGEFEAGIPISYDEEKGILGIFDVENSKKCYYDNKGDFLNFETMEIASMDLFFRKTAGLKVRSYRSLKVEIGEFSPMKNIDINGKNILSLAYPRKGRVGGFPLRYSINNGIVYFSELSNNKLTVYAYSKDSEDLKKIPLAKSDIALDKGIRRFISFDDYLIIMDNHGEQHFFSLSGNYLGTTNNYFDANNPEVELKWFDGAFGEYLYLVNYVDSELESIDVYKAK